MPFSSSSSQTISLQQPSSSCSASFAAPTTSTANRRVYNKKSFEMKACKLKSGRVTKVPNKYSSVNFNTSLLPDSTEIDCYQFQQMKWHDNILFMTVRATLSNPDVA